MRAGCASDEWTYGRLNSHKRDGDDEETPGELLTSAETRNFLCLLRNKVECSAGEERLMRCVKHLEDAFLGPSATTKQTSIMQFFSAK